MPEPCRARSASSVPCTGLSLSITQRGVCVLLDLHPQPIGLLTDFLKSHRRQRQLPSCIRPPAESIPRERRELSHNLPKNASETSDSCAQTFDIPASGGKLDVNWNPESQVTPRTLSHEPYIDAIPPIAGFQMGGSKGGDISGGDGRPPRDPRANRLPPTGMPCRPTPYRCGRATRTLSLRKDPSG